MNPDCADIVDNGMMGKLEYTSRVGSLVAMLASPESPPNPDWAARPDEVASFAVKVE